MSHKDKERKTNLKEGDPVGNGDYVLQSLLGVGGFGEVWLAMNVQLKNPAALKFICRSGSMKDVDALVAEEGRKLAQIRRGKPPGFQHVLMVYRHVAAHGDTPAFIELEYMEGGSLAKLLKEKHTLPEKEVLSLANQVGQGLQCAHRYMYHLDLKPDNILLNASRQDYVLADFGLSRRFEDMTGVRAGSPPYMSPEQFEPSHTTSKFPAADIYSLGVVLYECIEGHLPFPAPPPLADQKQTWAHYGEHHNKKPVPRLKNQMVSEQLKELVLSCLEKSASKRPTLTEFIARLQDLRQAGGSSTDQSMDPWRDKLVRRERGGRFEVRNTEIELGFVSSWAQAAYYVPQRVVTNRDFLRFVRDPAQSRWNPQQVPIYAHDGGYLKSWYQGQPLRGQEEEVLTSVPYEAALDFCRWSGGELPDVATVEKLLSTDPELPIARALRDRQVGLRLPYLLLWCRVEGLESERDGILYRFGFGTLPGFEMSLQPFLRRARRPRNYCFPFYTFFPVIPSEVVTNLPVVTGHEDTQSHDKSNDTDVDKTIPLSNLFFDGGVRPGRS